MNVGVLHPELLLLAIPALALLWRARDGHPATTSLRALGALSLVAALAGPYLRGRAEGRDVVLVVDRSRSMPAGSDERALELIALAEETRGPDDRVHVVTFGAEARVERAGATGARFEGFRRDLDADGSALADALEAGLELIGAGRGALVVLSDGEAQGRDPLEVARRAAARGARIDVRDLGRPAVSDVSLERVALPGEIAAGEPFQFDVWVRADRRVEREFALTRDGTELLRVRRTIEPGLQRFTLRDVVGAAGVATYDVALLPSDDPAADEDRVPENDRARGATLVTGPRAVLVLNEDGAEDTLSATLRASGLAVDVRTPEAAALDAVVLTRYRAVVLENVAASRLGRRAMDALATWTREHGGGLLMTGGRAAFGAGGYHRSPLDDVLPVSTELRQEHRKLSIAMAVALDRSGSMAAPVAGGTKMDLANAGAVAVIELLTPNDALAVIAVDSAAHVIQALTPVEDPGSLVAKVRRIRSEGGGIFTHTALRAAAHELERAEQQTRHIVLFADAADAEEHEGCDVLIRALRKKDTTLSVIALGTEQDSDAVFLKQCAELGGGRAYFTTDPADLPRLFAMDTLTVSRSTFVEEPTGTRSLTGLLGMGAFDGGAFPTLAGYNLCYLRPEATAGVITTDEYAAPVVAFWQRGLGRAAALTAQIGGTHGGALVAWPRFPEFAVTLTRWLAGNEPPAEYFAATRREGRDAVITVEVDPEAALPSDASRLVARFGSDDGDRREVALTRVDRNLFEARLPLDREGMLVGTVDLGDGRALPLAPLTLAYSPEYERGADPERGPRLLRQLAELTGGRLDPSAQQLFEGPRGARMWRLVTRELALLGLLAVLLEIAGRRLQLWQSVRVPRALVALPGRVRARRAARRTRATPEAPSASSAGDAAAAAQADSGRTERAPDGEPSVTARAPEAHHHASLPPTPRPETDGGLGSALERARRASQRKLDR